ncbi:4a-hydroxytetrahydrobiopterin dehydratase [Synechococcus sp. RSCCF101]|uniref:4a-hydroxytetrahydrobiopterin dehydratase n=1 Tax=Synechococcus sp. RSCCF101 TaxID=2511069 RepID=UPI001244C8A3|nr:4a-hydroxytetrahydrobiopterin dehydratase [Synechococcus sp. RSCCF101]QEY31329.1 4a-hydroxytetrahydrobiopterin dehydratase [Synechococcus sp. RSCCF101]
MEQPWTQRSRPERLERRLEFESYEATRDFLDRLGSLCEEHKRFPDISFGRTYVNLTLRPESDDAPLGDGDQSFAGAIDTLTA